VIYDAPVHVVRGKDSVRDVTGKIFVSVADRHPCDEDGNISS
jgi:hypothetical protein